MSNETDPGSFILETKITLPIIQFQTNKQILPAHDRNAATIPILLARNRASLSSLPLKQQMSQCR